MARQIWMIRHGETEWSKSGQHTGRTDLDLTDHGRHQAEAAATLLAGRKFAKVICSPLRRAAETCRILGYGDIAEISEDVAEWNYGNFEGKTSADIRQQIPNWSVWTHPIMPGGESIDEVALRARRALESCMQVDGDVAIFSHGHCLRILMTQWLGRDPREGGLFALDTASVSVLGYERVARVVVKWNVTAH
jgi:broad specificity phosphatase PhoE